jgi:hypothetical protein
MSLKKTLGLHFLRNANLLRVFEHGNFLIGALRKIKPDGDC